MTIESRDIIKTLLENNGVYPGDPQMYSIYEYHNIYGAKLFAVFTEARWFDLDVSPYVKNYDLLWKADTGLTARGKYFLENYG